MPVPSPATRMLRALVIAAAVLAGSVSPDATATDLDPANARFRRTDLDQGLSQSSVLAIAQDRHGFVWMGTQDGLNRYDGFDVRVFRPDDKQEGSLSNNWVGALALDGQGRLWAGTEAGLNRFDEGTERFVTYRHRSDLAGSLPGESVHALHVDPEGRLWVGTDGGLARWRPESDDFARFSLPSVVSSDGTDAATDQRVRALASDTSGRLWVGTVRGLFCLDRESGRFIPAADAGAPPAAKAPIHALLVDAAGRLWVGSEGETLTTLDLRTGRWQALLDPGTGQAFAGHTQVRALLARRDGSIWVGSEIGVDRVDLGSDSSPTVEAFRHHRHNPHSVTRGRVMSLLEDGEGTLWIGTWEGGASRLSDFNNRFASYDPDVPTTAALRGPGIAALAADGDALWLGGADGLYRFSPTERRLEAMTAPRGQFIYALVLRDDLLWVATRGGLQIVDGAGRLREPPLPESIRKVRTRRFLLDSGRIWFAADTLGLYLVDEATRLIRAFHPLAGVVTFIEVLDEETVLVGSHDGLYWFSRDGAQLLHRHRVRTGETDSGLPAGPSSLLRAHDGRWWLATYGGGLLQMELAADGAPEHTRFRRYGRESGLVDESINSLLEDRHGRLWLSINGYIARFEPEQGRFRVYDRADGTLARYWIGAQANLADGKLAFAGPDGVTLFDPDAIGEAPSPPSPLLTELELDNRPTRLHGLLAGDSPLQRPLHLSDRLRLPPARGRTVGLRFSAPEFVAPEQLRFAYRLEGFDQDWIETDPRRRFATYTNLPHGQYTFRVRTRNADGVWSAQEARLIIEIAPFWWQTWWAAAGFVLLAAGTLAGGFLLRIRELRRQREALQREVTARTADLQDAMQKLTVSERLAAAGQLTAGLSHEIDNPSNYVQVASQNLKHQLEEFHALLRRLGGEDMEPEVAASIDSHVARMDEQLANVLDGSRRINRIIQNLRVFSRIDEDVRKTIPVEEPLLAALHLLKSRFSKDMDVSERITSMPPIDCQPARLTQAYMCLVQNACQAIEQRAQEGDEGFRGRLEFATRVIGNQAIIEVSDNGCGIPPDVLPHIFEPFFTTRPVGEGSGLGLSVAWGIVAEHGGHIEVESALNQGSRFRVVLPLGNDAASAAG